MSIVGGYYKDVEAAAALNLDCVQVFTKRGIAAGVAGDPSPGPAGRRIQLRESATHLSDRSALENIITPLAIIRV